MAAGACNTCGNADNECECSERRRRRSRPRKPPPVSKPPAKLPIIAGDWVTRNGLIYRVAKIDKTPGGVTRLKLERGKSRVTAYLSECEFYSHVEPDVI